MGPHIRASKGNINGYMLGGKKHQHLPNIWENPGQGCLGKATWYFER